MFSRAFKSFTYSSLSKNPVFNFHTAKHTATTPNVIVDGNKLASNLHSKLKTFIEKQASKDFERPGIACIILNKRVDSRVYIRQKIEACKKLGINFHKYEYSTVVGEEIVLQKIDDLNEREDIHGIMLEMPMPEYLMPSTMRIINRIKPSKDIEAITDENMSNVFFGEKEEQRIPATPAACLHILKEYGVNLSGKHCVVANRSRIVGLPLSKLLLQQNATVTMCNPLKGDVGHIVSKADVLFSAVGKYNIIKPEWIKEGAVVVDIGTNFVGSKGSKKMVGDLHFDQIKQKAGLITPVPGGVGPLTVMMLTKNIVEAWANSHNIPFRLE